MSVILVYVLPLTDGSMMQEVGYPYKIISGRRVFKNI